jgi:acetyl-CoA carboxylase carboxyl transferase subunit alpha
MASDMEFEKPLLEIETKITELTKISESGSVPCDTGIAELKRNAEALKKDIYSKLTPWQIVQIARHSARPQIKDYIAGVFEGFVELHGDRLFGDDRAIIGGFARIDKYRVMLIGHQKGRNTEENVETNFGMGSPEGYRKALRLMKLAEKFGVPVISLVDTPGAYPGAEAEARGQAEAIARNLTEMATLEVPIIVVVTGEGGSGGALGIAVGDVLIMLSNSVYSVISPEGCASILWRDGAQATRAADALKLTAPALKDLGVVDEIVQEPLGGAHRSPKETIAAVKECLLKHLKRLTGISARKLVDRRYEKYAAIGKYKHR